jgi:hypothetical protein
MRLEAYPLKQNCGKIDFCRDKVTRTCGPGIFDPPRWQRLSHGLYFTYTIIHNLEKFEGGRMDARYGILPRVKILRILGQS